jgi:hypothetical protein
MRVISLSFLLLASAVATASAQVGHPPDESPYRDIPTGHSIMPLVSFVGGGGGPLGVGPHNGVTVGGRYDLRVNYTLGFAATVTTGKLDRLIVNPFVKLANRTTGPVQQRVTFADVTVEFNVTGSKSWHGLAPYTGLTGGLAFAKRVTADTSGYKFGSRFYVAPQIGTRYFLTQHVMLRAEVRGLFWRLRYPSSFAQEPVEEPGTADSPNAVRPAGNLTDWTLTPQLQLGLGYVFRW